VTYRGHRIMCTDWEKGESYRRRRDQYGERWEAKFRQRYEKLARRFWAHYGAVATTAPVSVRCAGVKLRAISRQGRALMLALRVRRRSRRRNAPHSYSRMSGGLPTQGTHHLHVMMLDLIGEETAALLREIDRNHRRR
jgi:hypothetical protein